MRVEFVIVGEPFSKANSRRLVHVAGQVRFVKSAGALDYERGALLQIPVSARLMYAGPVAVTMRLYYADESIILDVLQARYSRGGRTKGVLVRAGVYVNDRQVREKHIYHAIDAFAPRAEVEVASI
jgi:hypothetical protein